MQDAIAIAISIAAGLWLVRTIWRQIATPSCGKADTPADSDGFVPLETLAKPAKKSGRP
ncbi:MAG: hypothetical protein WCR51_03835 [Planctomycetia bacterium]